MHVVGIAGGTASGKSTITRALAKDLGPSALLISHDRYYRTLPEQFRGNEIAYNFDHPDALDTPRLVQDITALTAGRSTVLVDYDFGVCRRAPQDQWLEVQPPELLVIEGILVLAVPELRAVFDHAVFVDAPADVRLARRLQRDIVERGDTPKGVIDQYFATVRPMHDAFVEPSRAHADLVLDGTGPVPLAIDRIRSLIGR